MSAITDALTLLFTQLETDIQAAWPDIVRIYDEQPREEVERENWPYAVYELEEVEEGFEDGGTAVQVAQRYTVKISARWQMPSSRITLFKAAKFDAITNLLMPSDGTYAGFGYLPLVPKRRFNEGDNLLDDSVEISLDFTVLFAVDYH